MGVLLPDGGPSYDRVTGRCVANHSALRTLLESAPRSAPDGYCLGLSLRDLQEVLYETPGEVVSLSACHRLVWEAATHVKALQSAAIEAPPAVVIVDGLWVKIAYSTGEYQQDAQGRRRAVKCQEKRVTLSALGRLPGLEKPRTNSGPFLESTSKHSIHR
jgi:hypothetical protein